MQFATAKTGVILVNLNLRFRAHELEFVLKQAGCKGLVMQPAFRDCDYVETLHQLAPELDTARPASCTPRGFRCCAMLFTSARIPRRAC